MVNFTWTQEMEEREGKVMALTLIILGNYPRFNR